MRIKDDEDGDGIITGTLQDFVQLGLRIKDGGAIPDWRRSLAGTLSREHFMKMNGFTVIDIQAIRACGLFTAESQ